MTLPSNIADREHRKFVEDGNGNVSVRTKTELDTDSGISDAFGRLRISEPSTIFDSKQVNDNQPLLWDDQEVSGSGTSSSHSVNLAASTLSVSATTAGKRVRQTFQRFNYQPAKSQLIYMTGVFANQTSLSGITVQIGAFDDQNGLFFSFEDGVMNAVRRTYVTGSAVDNKVAQSSWNLDSMDGTGVSGVTLDFTKTQIIVIDYEWLGVGRVRMGWNVDGKTYYCHQMLNANNLSDVYISTPNLPLRYSIENDGAGAATSMKHICNSVISEGGRQDLGSLHEIDNGVTEVTATTGGTTYALLGIRLNSGYLDSTIDLAKASVLMTSAGAFHWEIILNPTIDGSPTWGQLANSGIDWFTGSSATTITGGKSLSGEYAASSGGGQASAVSGSALQNAIKLGSAIDGTQDTIVLAVTAIGDGETFLGSLTMRELI